MPVDVDPEAPAVDSRERDERLVHPGEVRRTVVGLGENQPEHEGAHGALAGSHPEREGGVDAGDLCCQRGGVAECLCPGEVDARQGRISQSKVTARASSGRGRTATRSPRRWEQVMPAASMNALSPIVSATLTSQVARSRAMSSRGRSRPPESEEVRGVVTLRRVGDVPPIKRRAPAKRAAKWSRS